MLPQNSHCEAMMSTKDRILKSSLALFNEEGEAAQSAVDIANALDMSPGNLYYHFKGKSAIIAALYDDFEAGMHTILRGAHGRITSIEDNWLYIYILLEEIFAFRFFYRNLGELLARYPALAVRFRALMAEQRQTIRALFTGLEKAGVLHLSPRMKDGLAEQVLMALTFWLSMDAIAGTSEDESALIHKTVFSIMALVVPHMGAAGFDAMQAMSAYYDRAVGREPAPG